jgi:DHA1 family bicyclomycin/chloramphenicol resistance-like MFS transporter
LKLRPDTLALTATLAFLTSLLPLSTDMYLPSLPAIGAAFAATPAQTQLTLSMFLAGMVAGQLFYGPLSDSFGRRPVMIGGLAIFVAASVWCALADSIATLTAARFAQALGAAAPVVVVRAVVRDLYDGAHGGKELSRIGAFMGLIPAFAPVLGGALEQAFGWRANFVVAAAFAASMAALAWMALPESNAALRPWAGFASIRREYRAVFASRLYRVYVALLMASHAGLFTFISAATFVLQGVYGLTPLQFGMAFGLTGLGYTAGAFTAQRIVTRLGLDGTIRIGVVLLAAAGLSMLAFMLAGVASSLSIIGPAAMYTFGHGLVQPQAQAGSSLPHPARAGAAASLGGMFQLGASALYGIAVAAALARTPLALPIGMACAGCGAAALFIATRGLRARGD